MAKNALKHIKEAAGMKIIHITHALNKYTVLKDLASPHRELSAGRSEEK